MNKFDEEIAMLENALEGALLVPSECTFVSSEVIKSCLDTLKAYESWEELIRYEIEEKIRADERAKIVDQVIEILKTNALISAMGKIEQLKSHK